MHSLRSNDVFLRDRYNVQLVECWKWKKCHSVKSKRMETVFNVQNDHSAKAKKNVQHTHIRTPIACMLPWSLALFCTRHLQAEVCMRERQNVESSVCLGRELLFIDKLLLCTGFVDDRSDRLQIIWSRCDMHKNWLIEMRCVCVCVCAAVICNKSSRLWAPPMLMMMMIMCVVFFAPSCHLLKVLFRQTHAAVCVWIHSVSLLFALSAGRFLGIAKQQICMRLKRKTDGVTVNIMHTVLIEHNRMWITLMSVYAIVSRRLPRFHFDRSHFVAVAVVLLHQQRQQQQQQQQQNTLFGCSKCIQLMGLGLCCCWARRTHTHEPYVRARRYCLHYGAHQTTQVKISFIRLYEEHYSDH